MTEQPNVLLIVMDAVRAANCSFSGYSVETTPTLSQLTDEEMVVYPRAWASSTWSLPSHTSMFTGYHVEEHNITTRDDKLREDASIFYWLRNEGYDTGLFTDNVWLGEAPVGLDAGFETIQSGAHLPYPDAMSPKRFLLEEEGGKFDYLIEALRSGKPIKSLSNGMFMKLQWEHPSLIPEWLLTVPRASFYAEAFNDWAVSADGPWAACINFMDAHQPCNPSKEYNISGDSKLRKIQDSIDSPWEFYSGQRKWWEWEAIEGLYDGCIREADEAIKRIVTRLKKEGMYDNTLIVITSDHGEGFGERSNIEPARRVAAHGSGIHERLLRVPLLVKFPEQNNGVHHNELATNRRFAAAVKKVVSNPSTLPEVFEPEDGVVRATFLGMDRDGDDDTVRSYAVDTSLYDRLGRAAYSEEQGQVIKYVSWGDKAGRVVVQTPQVEWLQRKVDEKDVAAFFDGMTDADIREAAGSMEEVQDRLEDLGYK